MNFRDRSHAGDVLAERLGHYGGRDDVLVLALPRGGVPVATQVAAALAAPLEILLVRKLGVPGQEELAMGAIALIAGQYATVLNERIITGLGMPQEILDEVADRQREELARCDRLYRDSEVTTGTEVRGRIVIVVDDGLATGATMRAAVTALRGLEPARIVVAAPVAAPDTVIALRGEVDEVVCPLTPARFGGVGQWYDDFSQVTDDEVRERLSSSSHGQSSRSSFGSS